jgi:hypothetical protein
MAGIGVAGGALKKILGLILLIVVLPIFAGLAMLSAGASAGIVSMGDIIIQFMPIFGIGAESRQFGQKPLSSQWVM